MASITCQSCGSQCFQLVVVEMADKKDNFLILFCCDCKEQPGIIQSTNSLKLTMHIKNAEEKCIGRY
jgi:hypothetical protein